MYGSCMFMLPESWNKRLPGINQRQQDENDRELCDSVKIGICEQENIESERTGGCDNIKQQWKVENH